MDNNVQWHSAPLETTLETLKTTQDGLSTTEAEYRFTRDGANKLPESKRQSELMRFLAQFNNVLIYVLLAASLVTAVLGHWIDASVIFGVVIINALIGFIQEGKAENALRAIQQMLSPHATVIRDAQQLTIDAEALVVGDIVVVQSGDKIPADLRLLQVKGLQIQESALTGESMAVDKTTEAAAEESVLGDRYCMAYSGTLVTHGQGTGVVVATAAKTELGRISRLVATVEAETTPLLQQISQFARWLTLVIGIVSVALFVFGVWVRAYAPTEMFLAAISLAVAAIPEGLPAIMTITLAIGVQRMARRNAIIRKLPAVETLGAVSVICTDKTGTLTRNEMTVRHLVTAENSFAFTGIGYDPQGAITVGDKAITCDNALLTAEHSVLQETLQAGMLCNDAALQQQPKQWQVNGDPMEGALLIAGIKAGLAKEKLTQQYPRADFIPFDAEYRFMATLHHCSPETSMIYLKGAPEQIIDRCSKQKTPQGEQPLDRAYWLAAIDTMAQQGLRVLAIAAKPINSTHEALPFSDVASDIIILGLVGFIDPPREEVITALENCIRAGIRVKMITGDHSTTARAIAQQLKLTHSDHVLTGIDIEQLSEDELRQQVQEVDIYARVNPEHKLRLVRLLQEHGLIVAMTGDGVNDAPALKQADIGTAMGINGTEAAKEAAEMVLADDNFASIIHAVEEGRTVYDNLKKSIIFILPTNVAEALIVITAIALGFHQLPLTPVQILWVNMITAVTLALALVFEPAERHVMQRLPRDPNQPILTKYLIWRVIFVSVIIAGGTMGLFLWQKTQGVSIEYARTVAVNTLVLFEIFYLFNSRYITASILNKEGLTGNPYILLTASLLLVFQLGFTYLPPMQTLFGTTAINLHAWLYSGLVAFSVLLLVELEKFIVRRMGVQV